MIVYCPDREGACINALVCAYGGCFTTTKLKCPEYEKNYDKLKSLLIEKKYLTKYGLPDFPEPRARQKKKVYKPRVKKVKPEPVKVEPVRVELVDGEVKPRKKRRSKEEMALAKSKGEK